MRANGSQSIKPDLQSANFDSTAQSAVSSEESEIMTMMIVYFSSAQSLPVFAIFSNHAVRHQLPDSSTSDHLDHVNKQKPASERVVSASTIQCLSRSSCTRSDYFTKPLYVTSLGDLGHVTSLFVSLCQFF